MSGLRRSAALIAAVEDVRETLARDVVDRIPARLRPTGPHLETFTIDGGDVGIAVRATATRSDGRLVQWNVETYFYTVHDGRRRATIKAEIDLDDASGDDRCIVNEQDVVDDEASMLGALANAAMLLVRYPLEPLLTDGTEPTDFR